MKVLSLIAETNRAYGTGKEKDNSLAGCSHFRTATSLPEQREGTGNLLL